MYLNTELQYNCHHAQKQMWCLLNGLSTWRDKYCTLYAVISMGHLKTGCSKQEQHSNCFLRQLPKNPSSCESQLSSPVYYTILLFTQLNTTMQWNVARHSGIWWPSIELLCLSEQSKTLAVFQVNCSIH